jgi:hypothetical protein
MISSSIRYWYAGWIARQSSSFLNLFLGDLRDWPGLGLSPALLKLLLSKESSKNIRSGVRKPRTGESRSLLKELILVIEP